MDTSDPEITFDREGRCCHCTGFLEKRAKYGYQGPASDNALNQLINDIKLAGRGRQYDCVIGVSGGVDSSYLAYIAKASGLRILAVHMDNGWDSETAVSNIKNVVSKLGIDYESYVLDWEEFKDLQLAFLKASVPEAETPTDVAIPAALHYFAAKHNVKYILSGSNLVTEGILPKCWHYDVKDLRYLKYIHRTYGTRSLRTFPTFGYKKEAYYKLVKGIRTFYPLDHIDYDKERAKRFLISEFGWKDYGGKHYESRYTKFIQSYYLFEKFGIDYRRVGLAMQICEGAATRETALQRLNCVPYDPPEVEKDKEYISKKLNISKHELDEIISRPAKWYWELPNEQAKLGFIYNTYRMIYRKEKMDRF
jgi:N-acetyl sugar amidotransferase